VASLREWFGFPPRAASLPINGLYSPQDALVTFAVTEQLRGDLEGAPLTREIAMRVAPLRRAHNLIVNLVAAMNLREQESADVVADQPAWLTNSASGVSPYHRMRGICSDLFWTGWACVGFELGEDKLPIDAMWIPEGYWGIDSAGQIVVKDPIPEKYRQRVIAIPLGGSGILVDGHDTIAAHRAIERAWQDRVDNPLPQTNLHITDPKYDGLTKREKRKIVDEWNENRKRAGGQTAVTPSFIDVEGLGQTSADLFEKGRNAIRLDIANLTDVPAAMLEGSKDGSGGDIRYSNETAARGELFDFTLLGYVKAIEARLSLDDVCAPGRSMRFDRSELTSVPSPTVSAPTED